MKTVVLGCSLQPDQTTSSYTLSLKALRSMVGMFDIETVQTDAEQGLVSSLPVLDDKSRHQLCFWHIKNNVEDYGRKHPNLLKKSGLSMFVDEFDAVCSETNIHDYNEAKQAFLKKYPGMNNYLIDNTPPFIEWNPQSWS